MNVVVFLLAWMALAVSTTCMVVWMINLLYRRVMVPRVITHIARKHNTSEDAVRAEWDRLDNLENPM